MDIFSKLVLKKENDGDIFGNDILQHMSHKKGKIEHKSWLKAPLV